MSTWVRTVCYGNGENEPAELTAPQEETAKRVAQMRKLFIGLLANWKTTLLFVFLASYCWHERFWRDSVMQFTCPLLLFLLSLPILDCYNFSFLRLFRKRRESPRF